MYIYGIIMIPHLDLMYAYVYAIHFFYASNFYTNVLAAILGIVAAGGHKGDSMFGEQSIRGR